ncbi:hypothetical protein QE152_g40750 [Popillia japonica]|uniref:Transposase n=1 Tax=Popillia japonica TaxID=7064 RepID=A0AAW1HFC3_POPJA
MPDPWLLISQPSTIFWEVCCGYGKYKFEATDIWNLDESGINTVMSPPKDVAQKGKKQVAQASSGERGEQVTFVGIVNAAGATAPPIFIYP